MTLKLMGVCYDVGNVMWFNWRPDFDPKTVSREIEIIKNDLHCNAIRITGHSIDRLSVAAEIALRQGLEVWLYPTIWDKKPKQTLAYTKKAAELAEKLRRDYPKENLVFVVGGELTLFMDGIVEGRNVTERVKNISKKFQSILQEGQGSKEEEIHSRLKALKDMEHNKLLDIYLHQVASTVKQVFHGKITYASLVWESVDWSLFDYIGIDHYRADRIKDQYADMLKPFFKYGKPVVITEFGMQTYQGAEINGAGLGGNIIDIKSQGFHYWLPIIGRFIRPKIIGNHVRNEGLQARELVDQLSVLEKSGVYGAFVSSFVSQINPYDDDPRYDLDMASFSLVKMYTKGRHGMTYPDMPWEPKEAFKAVADYYSLKRD